MISANYASAQAYATTPQPLLAAASLPLDNAEGVSWRAVIAGAVAACALTFILFTLGTGLGLSALSPWHHEAADAATLAIPAVAWVIVTQLAASGVGGYMAGRLRGRWTRLRGHEVYFRDTAHGLLAWGLSTLIMASLMGTALGGAVTQAGGAAGTTALLGSGVSRGDAGTQSSAYWTDVLLRNDATQTSSTADQPEPTPAGEPTVAPAPTLVVVAPASPATDAAADVALRAQANRILVHALQAGAMSEEDGHALAQLVSQRTGLSQVEAQARVSSVFSQARKFEYDAAATLRQQAEDARKATAYSALWMTVALLAGAFIAAWLATFGGRQRDAAYVADEA